MKTLTILLTMGLIILGGSLAEAQNADYSMPPGYGVLPEPKQPRESPPKPPEPPPKPPEPLPAAEQKAPSAPQPEKVEEENIFIGQEQLDLQQVQPVELIIPTPGEIATWGETLNVRPKAVLEQDLLLYKYITSEKERGAIYLGRSLAILLLGIGTMDESSIQILFIKLKEGMQALEIDSQYTDQFNNLYVQFRNKAISRQDLTNQLDLAYANLTSKSSSKTSLSYSILQGAAWVQCQNLMAMAMVEEDSYDYAKLLLSRPSVVKLILNSLADAKKDGSPAEKVDPLIEAMEYYRKLTSATKLGENQVKEVVKATGSFLREHK